MKNKPPIFAVMVVWFAASCVLAQRVQFPQRTFTNSGWQSSAGGATSAGQPAGGLGTRMTTVVPNSGSQLMAPEMDAYSRGGFGFGGAAGAPPPPTFGQPGGFGQGTVAPPGFAQPGYGQAGIGQTGVAPPGQPQFGPGYSAIPPVAFPHATPQMAPWPQWNFGSLGAGLKPIRFVQGIRFQHTWLYGDDKPTHVDINDTAISVATVLPNFFHSGQPLYILPSFELHQWDGPIGVPPSTAELPSRAYSAYLDTYWKYDPLPLFGVELGGRVGIFTDFKGTTTDSLRVLGKALIRVGLTPYLSARAGAYYVDRAKIKMLPAGGFLWTPNDKTRFDIFFPEPKLAQKLVTMGTGYDVWWYLGGEFGGGSWTIERTGGDNDRIDINDVRATFGLETGTPESLREGRRTAFVEVGYVWDREVIYVVRPFDSFKPRDTIMVRAGIGY